MQTKHLCVLIHTRIEGEVDAIKPVIFLLTVQRWCFIWGYFSVFMFHVCLYYTVLSVHSSLVITCWERADLLTLLCITFPCVLSLSHTVSWVRCGTWLYRTLSFAFFTFAEQQSSQLWSVSKMPITLEPHGIFGSNFAHLFILTFLATVCQMVTMLCRASFWPVDVFRWKCSMLNTFEPHCTFQRNLHSYTLKHCQDTGMKTVMRVCRTPIRLVIVRCS